jgi:hypothetical protein
MDELPSSSLYAAEEFLSKSPPPRYYTILTAPRSLRRRWRRDSQHIVAVGLSCFCAFLFLFALSMIGTSTRHLRSMPSSVTTVHESKNHSGEDG